MKEIYHTAESYKINGLLTEIKRKSKINRIEDEEKRQYFVEQLNIIIINNIDSINKNNLADFEVFFNLIYIKGEKFSNYFLYCAMLSPKLLEIDNLLDWVYNYFMNNPYKRPPPLDTINSYNLTRKFNDKIIELSDCPGVYVFSRPGNTLYVGTSVDLGSRILSSYKSVYSKVWTKIYFKYIKTETKSDAVLLESYFIGKLKPILNRSYNHKDKLTYQLVPKPTLSKSILCSIKKRKWRK